MERQEIIDSFIRGSDAIGANVMQQRIIHYVSSAGENGASPAVLINRMRGAGKEKVIAEECANLVEEGILGVRPMERKRHGKTGFVFYVIT